MSKLRPLGYGCFGLLIVSLTLVIAVLIVAAVAS